MENASKALLMAGGVLLAMLVATLFVYAFTTMGDSSRDVMKVWSREEIQSFNQKFYDYEGRSDLRVQDVVTIINIANDNNDENNTDSLQTIVTVKLKLNNGTEVIAAGQDASRKYNKIIGK